MGVILWLFLSLAIVAIFYTIWKYKHTPMYQFKKAKSLDDFYMIKNTEGSKTLLHLTYHGVAFKGITKLGSDETSIKVHQVTVFLADPFDSLKGWCRDDFYVMEKEIYTVYPYAEIVWDQPIKDFLDKIDVSHLE